MTLFLHKKWHMPYRMDWWSMAQMKAYTIPMKNWTPICEKGHLCKKVLKKCMCFLATPSNEFNQMVWKRGTSVLARMIFAEFSSKSRCGLHIHKIETTEINANGLLGWVPDTRLVYLIICKKKICNRHKKFDFMEDLNFNFHVCTILCGFSTILRRRQISHKEAI